MPVISDKKGFGVLLFILKEISHVKLLRFVNGYFRIKIEYSSWIEG